MRMAHLRSSVVSCPCVERSHCSQSRLLRLLPRLCYKLTASHPQHYTPTCEIKKFRECTCQVNIMTTKNTLSTERYKFSLMKLKFTLHLDVS